jgi:membrane protease YdiL (CAAX protease family)
MNIWFFVVLAFAVFFFLRWVLRSEAGKRSFDNSPVRENYLPMWVPFFLFGFWVFSMVVFARAMMFFTGISDEKDPVINQSSLAASSIITSFIGLLLAAAFFKDGLKGFGLDTRTAGRDILRSAGVLLRCWPAVIAVMITIGYVVDFLSNGQRTVPSHPMLDFANGANSVYVIIFVGIIVTFVAPVHEEILFRGFVQTKLAENMHSRWLGILLTSAFFAVFHGGTLWMHWPALFIFSCALGYVYEKSGSLLQAIFMHAMFNGANFLLSFVHFGS